MTNLSIDDRMALSGRESPPMANGELIFESPWESRVFGMARLLCEKGLYDWDEFRACLISEVERWDRMHVEDKPYQYYQLFYSALEKLLLIKNIYVADDLIESAKILAERPHGHDH